MKKTLLLFAVPLLVLQSCSGPNSDNSENLVAKGDKVYGNYLRVSEQDNFQTLYPVSITDAVSGFIATQIHDGLVRLDPTTLKVIPAIASKWEVDATGTKYTFTLNKEAKFQDDECFSGGKGRAITAEDFKYSFELLCSQTAENENFSSTFKDRVLGANEYYAATANGGKGGSLTGVKVINENTLEITLAKPNITFLNILCEPVCSVVAKEAITRYGKALKTGAGAFIYDNVNSNKEKLVLKRNPNYYGVDSLGNKLPFLDSVIVYIMRDKDKELTMFKEGKLDIITSLPSQSVKEMVEEQIKDFQNKPPKFLLDNSPEMIVQYYTFNTKVAPFDNPKVRQAFNLAINRQKIVEDVLNGQAYGPGTMGITPPTFTTDGYDITQIKGYDFDVEQAKKLLAEAGYPGGKGFPNAHILVNQGNSKNTNVVVEVQKQLFEHLGINVDFDAVPMSQKLDDAAMGRAMITRDAWIADYPSPETFLTLFYGANVPADPKTHSFPNTARYQNAEFDKYYLLGRDATNRDSSMANFMRAEQILMKDSPIMVLWYEGNYRLTQWSVKNCPSNAMRYRNFSNVYIKKNEAVAKADSTAAK